MWERIEERIQENEADPNEAAPLRRKIFDAIQEAGLSPGDGATKKMVSLHSSKGCRLVWEIQKPATNVFLDAGL